MGFSRSITVDVVEGGIAKSVLAATGTMIYGSAPSTPAGLAAGAARRVLRMNAAATAPEWEGAMGARWTRAVAQSVPDNTITALVWDTQLHDDFGLGEPFATMGAPRAGLWLVYAALFCGNVAGGIRWARIVAPAGAFPAQDQDNNPSATQGSYFNMATEVRLAVGQLVSVEVFSNYGGSMNFNGFFGVEWKGP